MLSLYRFTGATCAAKILLALSEKALPFEDMLISRAELSTDWYRALNPSGLVPTLVHDDNIVTESTVILNYLEDTFPDQPLRPSEPLACARMNHWMKMADDLLGNLFMAGFIIFMRQSFVSMSAQDLESYYSSLPDYSIRQSRRNAIELGMAAPEAPETFRKLANLQRRMNESVQHSTYLVGDYSLADVSLTPFLFRLETFDLLIQEAEAPHLHRWWRDIRGRRSFEEAITSQTPIEVVNAARAAAVAQAAESRDMMARSS